MGVVDLTVLSDVKTSKFGNRNEYVEMEIDGFKREYYVENAFCADALRGMAGSQVTLEAHGSRDDASIEVIRVEEGAVRPPQRQSRPPQQSRAPQRQSAPAKTPQRQEQRPAPQREPAAQPANRPRTETTSARKYLIKLTNTMLKCEVAVDEALKIMERERGVTYTPDARQAKVAMLFIQLTRDNYQHQQPDNHLISVAPKTDVPEDKAAANEPAAPEGEEADTQD